MGGWVSAHADGGCVLGNPAAPAYTRTEGFRYMIPSAVPATLKETGSSGQALQPLAGSDL